ncbi:unnamed protein product [Gadus morhua 'NCC']
MEALRHALVISKCVLNKPPVQKKKAVLPAVAQTQEGPPHRAGDLEPISVDAPRPTRLTPQCAPLNKPPVQEKKVVLPAITKTRQRPVRPAGDLERLDMDALQPALLTCQSAVLNKKVVLPAIGKTQQRPLRLAGDLKQAVQKQKKDGQHLATADALLAFGKHLTPFERREIEHYKEVWYLGIAAEKIQETSGCHHGYDDFQGHYKMVIKDHIAYRYEVLEVMGEGTYGRVFKSRDHKTKQLVAMKVIANNKMFAAVATAEVEILELLQKNDENGVANVVHMKEHFHFRNHMCITFDLMGKNLYEVTQEREFRGMGSSEVRSHAASLLQSLQFLSRTGVIHCDLKPENILVSKEDSEVIKVSDFGASRLEHLNTYPVTQTLLYMSPEVLLEKAYSKPIDMWSLGCILAELKTGESLFLVSTKFQLLEQMMKLLGLPPKGMLKKSQLKGLLSVRRNSRQKNRRHLSKVLDTDEALFIDFVQRCLTYDPAKRMTAEEAMQHPWIHEQIQSPSSSSDAAPHQSTDWEHKVDSTSCTAQSTFRARHRPVGSRGRRRERVPNDGGLKTLLYMSPEVLLEKAYNKPNDMWSLGCLLAELKTGKSLFLASAKFMRLQQIKKLLGLPLKGMLTADKAMQHPWILKHIWSPSSSADAAPHQPTDWEHMVDSPQSTSRTPTGRSCIPALAQRSLQVVEHQSPSEGACEHISVDPTQRNMKHLRRNGARVRNT